MEESTTYQEIIEKGIEKGMEKGIEKGMEKGLQRGLQTGIERGIEKGRVTEARAMLLRLGTRKFGAPAPKVISHLNSLSDVTELESLGERVVDKSVKTWNQLLE